MGSRVASEGGSVAARAKIAVLNVSALRDAVLTSTGASLRVLHEPAPDGPSHSGIHGIPMDDNLIAEEMALAVLEVHPAKA